MCIRILFIALMLLASVTVYAESPKNIEDGERTQIYTIEPKKVIETPQQKALKEKHITEGCKKASVQFSGLISEAMITRIVRDVTGANKSYMTLCQEIARDFIYKWKSYEHILSVFGSSMNKPEKFDQKDGKCIIELGDGTTEDSSGNCNSGCLIYTFDQPDKHKRAGFMAGHQIIFQTSRYNITREPHLAHDLEMCLLRGDRFTCLQNTCIGAYRTYKK